MKSPPHTIWAQDIHARYESWATTSAQRKAVERFSLAVMIWLRAARNMMAK